MNNDKKKTLVLAALGSVLLAVGAFQFIGGGGGGGETPAPAPKPKPAEKSAEAQEPKKDPAQEQLLAMVSGALPQRDPFQVPLSPQELMPKPPTPPPPAANTAPRRSGGSGGGMVPPLSPMLGNLPSIAGGMGMGLPNPGQPGAGLGAPAAPEYRVKGVIVGEKPMAVFEDAGGNQRLVPLGGSVDGDTEVVGIERGRVTVRQRGQRKTLTISEENRED